MPRAKATELCLCLQAIGIDRQIARHIAIL